MQTDYTTLVGIKLGSSYGILNDQLLIFDPSFIIKVHSADLNGVIEINTSYEPLEDFFGRNVDCISALVGKNGVGKSTTLSYLRDLFLKEKRDADPRGEDVVFFREGATLKIFINQQQRNYYAIQNHTDFRIEEVYFRDYPKVFDHLKNYTTVFYSNSLESDLFEKETTNYYNISTGFLKEQIGKINSRIRSKRIRLMGGAKRFRYTELKRQSEFLKSLSQLANGIDIPFKAIDEIVLNYRSMNYADYLKLLGPVEQLIDSKNPKDRKINQPSDFWERYENIYKLLKGNTKIPNQIDEGFSGAFIPVNLTKDLAFYLMRLIFDDRQLKGYFDAELKFAFDIINIFDNHFSEEKISLPRLIEDLKKYFTRGLNSDQDIQREHVSRHPLPIIEKLDNVAAFDTFFKDNWEQFKLTRQSVIFDTRSQFFLDFFTDHYSVVLDIPFLALKWPSLSAGEESLIAYFSRLFSVLNDIKSNNVLMLIDEGDLYFHPEWQRDYIYFLMQFLNSRLFIEKSIQIIITTHSPFIISDLPKENITLLVRENAGSESRVRVDKTANRTFGGNIHQLFSENFFLGDTLISRFAQRKIKDDIISEMNKPLRDLDLGYLGRLIDKVGEPVLRSILSERLERRRTNG